jgi:hypothetical protein
MLSAAWSSISVKKDQAWIPPQAGHFKINFDTVIRDQFSIQATVCRDSNGSILKAISQVSPPCTPNHGEAQRALLAASLVASLHLTNFSIEGDSLIVISALQFPIIITDWQIEKLIIDTLALLPPSSKWEAKKINRSANFCAYCVAAIVLSGCISIPPPLSPSTSCSGLEPSSVFFFSTLRGCKLLFGLMLCLLKKKKKVQFKIMESSLCFYFLLHLHSTKTKLNSFFVFSKYLTNNHFKQIFPLNCGLIGELPQLNL